MDNFESPFVFDEHESDPVIKEIANFFANEGSGLAQPWISPVLRTQLNHVKAAQFLWSTREHTSDPYHGLLMYVKELLQDHAIKDYAFFGMSGHGMVSNVYTLVVVEGSLAFFMQCPWGNMNDDPAYAESRILGLTTIIKKMQEKLKDAQDAGLQLPGERLVVICNDFEMDRRYVWLQKEDHDIGKVQWKTGAKFLFDAMQSIPNP